MITYGKGNIVEWDAHALVNPVNCAGVMESGLNKRFKDAFGPNYYNHYNSFCDGWLKVGKALPWYIKRNAKAPNTRVVINLAVKDKPDDKCNIESIRKSINGLVDWLSTYLEYKTVAIPDLSGGELPWREVKAAMIEELRELPCRNYILFEPKGH